MGLIVLDTSVLIDQLRGDSAAGAALDGALDRGDDFAASVLTKVEVLAGMRSNERKSTRALLDSLTWIDVDEAIGQHAGMLARRFRASHRGVGVVDYVIAATSLHLRGELWTRNTQHFPMFSDLRSPY